MEEEEEQGENSVSLVPWNQEANCTQMPQPGNKCTKTEP